MLPRIVPSSHAEAYQRTRADGPFGGEIPIGVIWATRQPWSARSAWGR